MLVHHVLSVPSLALIEPQPYVAANRMLTVLSKGKSVVIRRENKSYNNTEARQIEDIWIGNRCNMIIIR